MATSWIDRGRPSGTRKRTTTAAPRQTAREHPQKPLWPACSWAELCWAGDEPSFGDPRAQISACRLQMFTKNRRLARGTGIGDAGGDIRGFEGADGAADCNDSSRCFPHTAAQNRDPGRGEIGWIDVKTDQIDYCAWHRSPTVATSSCVYCMADMRFLPRRRSAWRRSGGSPAVRRRLGDAPGCADREPAGAAQLKSTCAAPHQRALPGCANWRRLSQLALVRYMTRF